MKRALWVGGPPGSTMLSIKKKLLEDGIEVVDIQNPFAHLQHDTDLVLINIEMLDHNDMHAAVDCAKGAKIPYVKVSTSYTRTRTALEAQGLVAPRSASTIPETTETANMVAQPASKPPSFFSGFLVNFEAFQKLSQSEQEAHVAQLVQHLPPQLHRVVLHEAVTLKRKEAVKEAALALEVFHAEQGDAGINDLIGVLPEPIVRAFRFAAEDRDER